MFPQRPLDHSEEVERMRSEFNDHNFSDPIKQRKVLLQAISVLEERSIPYALIGGIASKELGRPRITHDIDIFLCPEDANAALSALKKSGFKTEKRDPFWLYKAWKDDILVDIIFKSSGDIYFDEELQRHVRRVPYKGHHINSVSPEDFVVIKAAVHQEHIPHHWHDALSVLTQGNLDWNYLLRRSRFSPRRVLALLIYAQSNDIGVPNDVIESVYQQVFGASTEETLHTAIHPYREIDLAKGKQAKDSVIYTKGRIMEALNTDERIADHDIKVMVTETSIDVRGEVFTDEQKQAVREVLRKISPEREIHDYVEVRALPGPEHSEVIQ